MKLEVGMKMAMISVFSRHTSKSPSPTQWSEVTITRVGRKYAYVKINEWKECKFNLNIFEKSGDNRSFGHYLGCELHRSIEEYENAEKQARIKNFVSTQCHNWQFSPTYEQCVEIAKIMNWSLE
jgi:hypothetical protein